MKFQQIIELNLHFNIGRVKINSKILSQNTQVTPYSSMDSR